MEVPIPDGVAILREKVDVRGRQALDRTLPGALPGIRAIAMAKAAGLAVDETSPVTSLSLSESDIEGLQRFQAAAVVAFLKTWSIDQTVPRTIDEVLDLDPDIYTPIAQAVSPLALAAVKRPKTNVDSGMKPDGTPDLDSPTGPSTGSESGERAASSTPGDPSTETSQNGTTSTDTGASSAA